MATLSTTSSGAKLIQFSLGRDQKRQTIRLPKMTETHARRVRGYVDDLIAHALSGQPLPSDAAGWVGRIRGKLRTALERVGLLVGTARGSERVPLGPFLDGYIKSRTDLKPWSRSNLERTRDRLIAYFGAQHDLREITRADCQDWHRAMKEDEYAKASIAGFVRKARQMLKDAVDRELIPSNPLAGIKAGRMTNAARQQYVPAETILKVIEHCPDHEWKAIFALARFGGLRVPSETTALRAAHIDWEAKRITVPSPKTAHHEGREVRTIPLFPALVTQLRPFSYLADPGQHVIQMHRGENLRTTARKIIKAAGFEPWPRLFQNLRSSFETDLTSRFPLHVACAWAGNTEAVALSHYLQVTDDHFAVAVSGSAARGAARGLPENAAGFLKMPLPLQFRRSNGRVMSAVGAETTREMRGFLHAYGKALSRALRNLRKAAPLMRGRDILFLRKRVHAAKRRVAGRRVRR